VNEAVVVVALPAEELDGAAGVFAQSSRNL
jgi:hypothetical protein